MYIRQSHSVKDRIKIILLLLLLLVVLGKIAKIVHEDRQYPKASSIKLLLETAMKPIGSTMYIWGGGWNRADSAAGASSTHLGLSLQWEEFASHQDENYDFNLHRYERENGLDCSGYVGWVLYNTFEKESGLPGYVTLSTKMAESLANRGWGELIKNPKMFLPGDIVSMDGHVWICLGTCADGSVLLVHSSPPGVSVCGTSLVQKEGEVPQESHAVKIATEYMQKQHPTWQEKYPNRAVSYNFLENVSVFRWNESVMLGAEKFQSKSAEEIIKILSQDIKP